VPALTGQSLSGRRYGFVTGSRFKVLVYGRLDRTGLARDDLPRRWRDVVHVGVDGPVLVRDVVDRLVWWPTAVCDSSATDGLGLRFVEERHKTPRAGEAPREDWQRSLPAGGSLGTS